MDNANLIAVTFFNEDGTIVLSGKTRTIIHSLDIQTERYSITLKDFIPIQYWNSLVDIGSIGHLVIHGKYPTLIKNLNLFSNRANFRTTDGQGILFESITFHEFPKYQEG